MKKKLLTGFITAGLLFAGATSAFAVTLQSPAEIYANLKGITVEEAYAERAETGNSFGQLADEAGILDEYKADMLENKKALIQQRVDEGKLTQERADAIIERMEARQAQCDGSGGFGQWRDRRPDGQSGFFGQGHGKKAGAGGCWGGRGF